MSNHGAAIEIFLVDGKADGVWEIGNPTSACKAVVAPRKSLKDLQVQLGKDRPGVYLLIGPSEDKEYSSHIYVGKSKKTDGRLNAHHSKKEFWTRAIVFFSDPKPLNTSYIEYLEERLISLGSNAKRAKLENKIKNDLTPLSKSGKSVCETFLEEILLICRILGVEVFQKPKDLVPKQDLLSISRKGVRAEGASVLNGFFVFNGSCAVKETTGSIGKNAIQLRDSMIKEKILVNEDDHYCFTKDYEFTSPSLAASVVLGRSANGRLEWKTADGQTLKELQEPQESDSED